MPKAPPVCVEVPDLRAILLARLEEIGRSGYWAGNQKVVTCVSDTVERFLNGRTDQIGSQHLAELIAVTGLELKPVPRSRLSQGIFNDDE